MKFRWFGIRRQLVALGLCSSVITVTVHVFPAAGAEPNSGEVESRKPAVDCRYESEAVRDRGADDGSTPLPFPKDDVFRPLLADPKQPQFFAAFQVVQVKQNNTSLNVGSVGFGENFGLYSRRQGCNGWQIGILGGVFSQFNLDASSADLLNTDFVIGIPVSWRSGPVSLRARLYHQSSHLGDELLLGNPEIKRVNLSFEEVEALLSLDTLAGWGRVYAGGGYLIQRTPDMQRGKVQWGVELRGPITHSLLFGKIVGPLQVQPLMGADFKVFEQLDWNVNSNVVAGVEWSAVGSTRHFRLLLNYYYGYTPYGQFYGQKTEVVGAGFYLTF